MQDADSVGKPRQINDIIAVIHHKALVAGATQPDAVGHIDGCDSGCMAGIAQQLVQIMWIGTATQIIQLAAPQQCRPAIHC